MHHHFTNLLSAALGGVLIAVGPIASSARAASISVPLWATVIQEWCIWFGAPMGLLVLIFTAVNAYLTRRKLAQEVREGERHEREAAREEMHQIHDAGERNKAAQAADIERERLRAELEAHEIICAARRESGICPLAK